MFADLTQPFRSNQLVELADLSPFRFHRVFQAMAGETTNEFVKRLPMVAASTISLSKSTKSKELSVYMQ